MIIAMKVLPILTFFLLIMKPLFAQDSVPGTALKFDGQDDYVNIGNPASLSFPGTAPFTIEAWVKPSVDNATGQIFTKFNLTVEGDYSLSVFNGVPAAHRETPPYSVSGTTVLQKDTWYHIASVYNGSDLYVFVNGLIEGQIASGSISGTLSDVLIGARLENGNPGAFFNGEIDEVRVWNVALTSWEIWESMGSTLTGTESGLVSYWQFNEGSGTSATDPINWKNGTLINMNDLSWIASTVPVNLFTFHEGFPGISYCATAWGDYDNDGDLDILLTGKAAVMISRIYRNDAGTFTNIDAALEAVHQGSVAWGDYDNDGDLDILLTGVSSDFSYISSIYRNDPSANGEDRVFTDINAGLPGAGYSSAAWGDYDNDGDLDILLTGLSSSNYISSIYRNGPSADGQDRLFTDINAGLHGVGYSSVAWGDYDNDGDLDIILTGSDSNSYFISSIYRNDPTPNGQDRSFTDINAELIGVRNGSVAWGDYDNDGDMDILITGSIKDEIVTRISKIYRNDSGIFTKLDAGLEPVDRGSVAWGDYDNDGDLDILLTGYIQPIIYRNDFGVFITMNGGLHSVYNGSGDWGDYDNDGDLDILLSGYVNDGYYISKIYQNNSITSNTAPIAPNGLSSTISADSIIFSWNKATDNETPQDGLSYNLVVGNTEYGLRYNSSLSEINDGFRTIPAYGNACQVTSWTYDMSELCLYPQVITPDYWGVQAVDHSFAGSPFSKDSLNIPISYLQTVNDSVLQEADTLFWEVQFGDSVLNYQVQIDDDSLFTYPEIDDTLYVSIEGGGYNYSTSIQDLSGNDALKEGFKYYWRIKPNYTFGSPTIFTHEVPFFWFGHVTAVDNRPVAIPKEFALSQNFPNPFNPLTRINYALPRNSRVIIDLYDILGRKIKTILDQQKSAGYHVLDFNAGDLASGIYLYRIHSDNYVQTRKMILVK